MILRLWWPQVPHLRVTPPPGSIPQRRHPGDTQFRPPHLRQGGVGDNLEVEGETSRALGSTAVRGEQPRPGWRPPQPRASHPVCGTDALSAVLTPAGRSVGRGSKRPGSRRARSLSSVPRPCLSPVTTPPESWRCGGIQEQKSEQREGT